MIRQRPHYNNDSGIFGVLFTGGQSKQKAGKIG